MITQLQRTSTELHSFDQQSSYDSAFQFNMTKTSHISGVKCAFVWDEMEYSHEDQVFRISHLYDAARNISPQLANSTIVLLYQDESEGEWVKVESQEELESAIQFAKIEQLDELRFYIVKQDYESILEKDEEQYAENEDLSRKNSSRVQDEHCEHDPCKLTKLENDNIDCIDEFAENQELSFAEQSNSDETNSSARRVIFPNIPDDCSLSQHIKFQKLGQQILTDELSQEDSDSQHQSFEGESTFAQIKKERLVSFDQILSKKQEENKNFKKCSVKAEIISDSEAEMIFLRKYFDLRLTELTEKYTFQHPQLEQPRKSDFQKSNQHGLKDIIFDQELIDLSHIDAQSHSDMNSVNNDSVFQNQLGFGFNDLSLSMFLQNHSLFQNNQNSMSSTFAQITPIKQPIPTQSQVQTDFPGYKQQQEVFAQNS